MKMNAKKKVKKVVHFLKNMQNVLKKIKLSLKSNLKIVNI